MMKGDGYMVGAVFLFLLGIFFTLVLLGYIHIPTIHFWFSG